MVFRYKTYPGYWIHFESLLWNRHKLEAQTKKKMFLLGGALRRGTALPVLYRAYSCHKKCPLKGHYATVLNRVSHFPASDQKRTCDYRFIKC